LVFVLGRDVQQRWKNIRACFSRELRSQKNTKSGQAAQKRRKYIYFDKLLFLLPSMEMRPTSGNAAPIVGEGDGVSSDEAEERQEVLAPPRRKPKKKNSPTRNPYWTFCETRRKTINSNMTQRQTLPFLWCQC